MTIFVILFVSWDLLVPTSVSMFVLPSSQNNVLYSAGCMEGPNIFLTVSSIAKSKNGVLRDRLIEINWNDAEPEPGDWVGLYDHHPDESGTDPLSQVAVTLPRGYIKSDYRFERQGLRQGQDPCLGWWIAYVRDSKVLLTNCLQIYPTWMQDSKDIIGDTPLHNLMIPGTHNSGAWKEYDGPNSDTVFLRYLVNQDESVYNQLMHGIRYLDIRVGYYTTGSEKFWINHDFYRMRPLSSLVNDVKKFVQESKDIVILDFHRFPVGFDRRERHNQLVEYLNSELERYTVPSTFWPNATPNDIWSVNRSVIISYSDTRTAQHHPNLWPPLPQEWGDKRSLPNLKSFLLESVKKRGGKGQVWAAMAEFTPKPLDIVLRPTQGLRNMAQTVNIPLTYWFNDKSFFSRANVIATDFFLGNNLVQKSINSNYKRAKCI